MTLLISFGIIALLILINGLFVAAEFSIIGVRPTRMEQLAAQGNSTARWLENILSDARHTNRYLAVAQLGVTLASLGLGMYAEPAIAHLIENPLHDWFGLQGAIVHTISFIVALGLITYLHIVLGEMVPKSLALWSAERTALMLAAPMRITGKIFSIPVTVLNRIGMWVLTLLRIPPPEETSRLYGLDELELIVAESYEEGLLQEQEEELMLSILHFAEAGVEQVMVPRPLMAAIPTNISQEEMMRLIADIPHSRFPVYGENLDDIVGMVHIKDLIRQQVHGQPFDLKAILRSVTFVPETLPVKTLLTQLQQQHSQMAIIMDEHGGTLGLVTIEDLLEEVVGEVRDEFDTGEEDPIYQIGPGHLVALGTAQLADLAECVPLPKIEHDVHTVGGLIWAQLGRRPAVGDEVQLGHITLRVEEMKGLTITKASIRYPSGADQTPAEAS